VLTSNNQVLCWGRIGEHAIASLYLIQKKNLLQSINTFILKNIQDTARQMK
jgi:hypothetical protein